MEALTLAAALLAVPAPEPIEAVLARFPDRQTALECEQIAKAHVWWLRAEIGVYPWKADYFEEWLYDADRFKNAWASLLLAHVYRESNCADCKYYLSCLRSIIGEENYLAGRMPPPVPFWYFTEIER